MGKRVQYGGIEIRIVVRVVLRVNERIGQKAGKPALFKKMEERIFQSFIEIWNLMQIIYQVKKRPRLSQARFGKAFAEVVGERVGTRGGNIGVIIEIIVGIEKAGLLQQPI